MARGILADGRLGDAARMIEPLLEPIDDPAEANGIDPGQLTLRCLMARVALLRRGDHRRALDLLRSYDDSAHRGTLDGGLRAEVALWLGWARAWQDDEVYDGARALNLLDAAEQDFRETLDPSGRCWALLGQAQAYFTIDEFRLMKQSLHEASVLLEKLEDVQAASWLHHLSVAAARFDGRYGAASRHADEVARIADATGDDFAAGRALAHRAAIGYETGRNPSEIVEKAGQAERLLSRAAAHPGRSLLDAYDAHLGALVRLGQWRDAEQLAEEAVKSTSSLVSAFAVVALHRHHLEIRRGDRGQAESLLEEAVDRLPRHRRVLISAMERARAECALAEGAYETARQRSAEALRHARDVGDAGRRLEALLLSARIAVASEDEADAREALRQAEDHTDYFSLLPFAAERFFIHGLVAGLRGRVDDARSAFAQALSAYSLVGDVFAVAETQLHIARLALASPSGESRALAGAALETFESLGAQREAARARSILQADTDSPGPESEHKEAVIGSVLARSAYSAELVAESWLQAAEELAPGRWLVVYRCDGDDWSLVHRRGSVPQNLSFPEPSTERLCAEGVDWMRLRGFPAPAYFFGMECGGDDDPACAAIEKKLLPWIPVVGLALEHAMLRADRLGESPADDELRTPRFNVDGFIYASPGMRRAARQIQRVRSGHAPVLITGEPGVGKSVVARAIHESSDRREAPFVPFACSSLARERVEAALFGSGPEGGAVHDARHGTLYLNDIGELPADAQPRLLQLLEDGFVRAAETDQGRLDVRIVASTGRDLRAMVRDGDFLEGLFYRLNVVPIRVPPLRERREEIPLLVHHFLKDLTHGRPGSASVTSRALDALIRYDWPGNVRQLRNEIERLLVFSATEPVSTIDAEDLSDAIREAGKERPVAMEADGSLDGVTLDGRGLDEILANAERSVIEQILARHDGQVSATAEALGLSRQGLYKKMKRLGIDASTVAQR